MPAATTAWIVAAIVVGVPGAAPSWALALALATTAALIAAVTIRGPDGHHQEHRRSMRSLAATLAVCFAVSGLVAWCIAARASSHAPQALHDAGTFSASVRVDSDPVAQQGSFGGARVKVHATLTRFEASGHTSDAEAPVVLVAPPSTTPLTVGSIVRARVTAHAMPDGDPVAFRLYARAPPELRAPAPPALAWADGLRSGFSDAATRLAAPGGGLLPGLAIGDVGGVGPELDAAMKASSLSHLTAVSGSNCAVIVAGVMALAAFVGLGRRSRVVLAVAALTAFVVLVTPGPSVLRAAVMSLVVIAALASGRPGGGVPALCVAVGGLLIADPWLARNMGFALSVLATAGLLVLAPIFARAFVRRMPEQLAVLLAIPISAQLACQPVLVLLQPAVSTFGVVANLLAEPAAPAATVLGLLACLVLPIVPGLGFALAQLAWLPAAWIAAVAEVTAGLPASALPWPPGIFGVAAATVLGFAVVVAASRRSAVHRTVRSAAVILLLVVLGGYAGGTLAGHVTKAWAIPRSWQLGACDVGQGDALVLSGGEGRFGVIDTGPDPAPLTRCLSDLGIDRVELLVLTHFDADHAGGAEALIGRVDTVLISPVDRPAASRLVARLATGGAHVVEAEAGMTGKLGTLDWRVLWPERRNRAQPGNDSSVTIETSGGGIQTLFLGDLGRESEALLLAAGQVGPVDIVKVAHHGSADQSAALYRALHARLGIVSVGADNGYGHPAPKTLTLLANLGVQVARTDLDGMLLVSTAHGEPVLWSER